MEIEVNEYVRTKEGYIAKLIEKDEDFKFYEFNNTVRKSYGDKLFYMNKDELEEYIVKHSKEIIDLVEVGDIVHIKDVLHEDITYIWSEDYLKALKEDIQNGIKLVSILTKEQMASIEYKV